MPILFNFELYSQNEVGNIVILVFVKGSSRILLHCRQSGQMFEQARLQNSTMVPNQLLEGEAYKVKSYKDRFSIISSKSRLAGAEGQPFTTSRKLVY